MNILKKYLKNLLKRTNLTSNQKKELEVELLEHLIDTKNDYIKTGLSEKEATIMAINSFKKSKFLDEIKDYSKYTPRLTGVNILYILKTNILLLIVYFLLISTSYSIIINPFTSNIVYFLITSFTLALGYYIISSNFEFKKDIISSLAILFTLFFISEKLIIIALFKIYDSLAFSIIFNFSDIHLININTTIIYIIISLFFIILQNYSNKPVLARKISLCYKDLFIILTSLILNIIYFLYPNRFYLLNLITSKLLKIHIESYNKNLLYMNINNKLIIINIGLFLMVIFIVCKITTYLMKKSHKLI